MIPPQNTVIERTEPAAGILVNNNRLVESLRSGLSSGQHASEIVPAVLEEIIEEGAWRDRQDRNGGRFTFESEEFTRFITDPQPSGLGTTLDEVRKYLGGADNPLRVMFEAAVGRGRGGDRPDQPRTDSGRFGNRNPNNIRIAVETDADTVHPAQSTATAVPTDPPPPRVRDRSREPQAGTSIGYAVRRLGRERPDLLERVQAGAISPNKAMVEAGFREKLITIPVDPRRAARTIIKYFPPAALAELVAELTNWIGEAVDPPES